jgi:hypothetical protein
LTLHFYYPQVPSTNNDPAVVARYYLNCVEQLGFVPKILRCDLGTGNTNLEFLQPFFRQTIIWQVSKVSCMVKAQVTKE